MGLVKRDLLWLCWSEYCFVGIVSCSHLVCTDKNLFINTCSSISFQDEDTKDYEWDHVTFLSMLHS